jgi:hypothetical protein
MKSILGIFVGLLLTVSFSFAQEAPQDTAVITFDKPVYEVGTIKPGSHVFEFNFTNTGKGVLTVTNVAPTCGCTIADWTKEPIKPGAKGVVKATFNAAAIGNFDKAITVYSNSKTPVMKVSFRGIIANPAQPDTNSAANTTAQPVK